MYMSDQVVKGCRPLRKGLQVHDVMAIQYMSEGYLRASTEGADNNLRLRPKVAIILIVYFLLY